MGRLKGSKNASPSTKPVTEKRPRGRPPLTVSKATQRAMDRAQADLNSGINIEAFNELAEIWFRQEDILATLVGEHRNRCKGPRGVQKTAVKRARDHGVPIEAAKLKLALMTHDRQKEKLRAAAEPDTIALVLEIERARNELGPLADTELGRAHLEAVRESHAQELDEFDLVNENARRIEEGISELPSEAAE